MLLSLCAGVLLMPGRPGRYNPLLDALDGLPPDQGSVHLTFAELETLLGAPLPASAQRPDYWTSSQVATLNWQRLGWRARLSHADQAVTFTRQPPPP